MSNIVDNLINAINSPSSEYEKPFYIFEKKQLLEKYFYQQLQNDFPVEDLFTNFDKRNPQKQFFNNSDKKFKMWLFKNESWKVFIDSMNHDQFLDLLFNKFKNQFMDNLNKNYRYIKKWKNTYNNNFFLNLKEKFNFLRNNNFKTIEIRIEFSRLKNGASLIPHTDVPSKLFSLLYYIPNKNYQFTEKSGGTNFWKSNSDKHFNNWQNDKSNEKKDFFDSFYDQHSIIHYSNYEHNKFLGFCKNHISWHSVDEIYTKNNQNRDSLNIFIREKN